MIFVGPKCGLKFPYEKEAEDDLTQNKVMSALRQAAVFPA